MSAINKKAWLVLGALLACLLAPLRATAAEVPSASAFTVKGTNGYSISVAGFPAFRGNPAAVWVRASTELAEASYATRKVTVTNTSVQADLGDLGEIDVVFRPSGALRPVRSSCGHETEPVAAGAIDLICPGLGSEGRGPGLPGAQLVAHAGPAGNRARLEAIKNRPGERARFEVGVDEKREWIYISRYTSLVAPPGSFLYSSDMRTATVRPPAPFSGAARFNRDAKPANRWSGNLTVDLPGRSDVALTGGLERANIFRASAEWPSGRSRP